MAEDKSKLNFASIMGSVLASLIVAGIIGDLKLHTDMNDLTHALGRNKTYIDDTFGLVRNFHGNATPFDLVTPASCPFQDRQEPWTMTAMKTDVLLVGEDHEIACCFAANACIPAVEVALRYIRQGRVEKAEAELERMLRNVRR